MDVLLFSRGQFKALFVVWVRRYLFIYLFIFLWLPALLKNWKQNRPFVTKRRNEGRDTHSQSGSADFFFFLSFTSCSSLIENYLAPPPPTPHSLNI